MELHPDTTADEPCELAPADEAPSQSFALGGFQGIPWTWWEIVLGLAPLVAVKIVVVPRAYSWLGVVGILAVAMGLYGWILFFPLAMARRRHRPVMQPTTFGKVILEGLIALALLPATYFLLFVALLVGLVVGGERAMPQ